MAGSISTKSPKDKSVQQVEGRSSERVPQLLAPSGPQADVLALQDAAGNRAVSQLLQSDIDSLAPGGNGLPPIVQDVLRSPGEPLDPAARAFMELRFNHDFREVRVHTDQRAAESAQIINALAYTVGRDVVFGASQYTPETTQGRCLLAHELAHVVQQSPGAKVFDCRLTVRATADNSLEREADAIGYAVALGRNAIVRRKTRPLLQTQSPRRDQTASPQQIEIDVIGHELGQGTERSADVNYPIRARDAIGADLVVTSLEDLIARLSALTAGNACVRKLTIWNHGSPRGQRVAFDGNDNDRWSGFNLRWLLKGANRRRLEQFRQVFCCGAEMRWMGCSTLAVETTWDPRSKPKRGRRPPPVCFVPLKKQSLMMYPYSGLDLGRSMYKAGRTRLVQLLLLQTMSTFR